MKAHHRRWLGWSCRAVVSVSILTTVGPLRAGLLEVTASDATPAAMAAGGFPGINGNNVVVGI